MKINGRDLLALLLATIWISLSEFIRNEFLLKNFWTNHYQEMGLSFPNAPVNAAIWAVWSLMFASSIFIISRKFKYTHTALLSWFVAFALMWLVIGNLGVLPTGILYFALPLSLIEAIVASLIVVKVSPPDNTAV